MEGFGINTLVFFMPLIVCLILAVTFYLKRFDLSRKICKEEFI